LEQALQKRFEILTTTDMALIVSPAHNEIAQIKKLGLDIRGLLRNSQLKNAPKSKRLLENF
jgi:hypothetical protein